MRAKRYGTGTGKTVRDRYRQNGTGPVRAKRYGTGTGKTIRDGYGQNGAGPVRAKRYGTGRGKTLRGPYGQNDTGPIRAKRYRTGTGKTVWDRYGKNGTGPIRSTVRALYRARCGHGTWPAPFPVCSPYGQRTGPLWVPVPWVPVPRIVVTAPTMPVRACLLGLFLLIVSSGALFIT